MKTILLCPDFDEGYSRYPFLGLGYVAATAREAGYPVEIIDAAKYANYADFEAELAAKRPDVLGITVLSVHYGKALKAARSAKKILPQVTVVLGGAHPTAMPEETIQNAEVDFVVAGEGELAFLQLLQALEKGSGVNQVKGIHYKRGDAILQTEASCPIEDLDTLPLPARDLLPMAEYLRQAPTIPLPYPTTSIMASRGCRGNCNYCQPTLRKLFGRAIRYRSPKSVVDEIAQLKAQYHVRGVFFADDEPTWERTWMLELCEELTQRHLNLVWTCASRVDTVDLEMLKAMKAAGCIQIGFGVESGSQAILRYYRKGVKVERVAEAFSLCRQAGIIARANFMVGAPPDTMETIGESIQLVSDIRPDLISVAPTTPTVGTDLFVDAQRQEWLRKDSLSEYDRRDISTMWRSLSDEEVRLSIKRILSAYRSSMLRGIVHPGELWERRYLLYRVLLHWLTLVGSPAVLVKDILYYLRYGNKETIAADRSAGKPGAAEA